MMTQQESEIEAEKGSESAGASEIEVDESVILSWMMMLFW